MIINDMDNCYKWKVRFLHEAKSIWNNCDDNFVLFRKLHIFSFTELTYSDDFLGGMQPFLQRADLQWMYFGKKTFLHLYIQNNSAVINTSNTVIYTSNNNLDLPEIHRKEPVLHPFLFNLPKEHLYFFPEKRQPKIACVDHLSFQGFRSLNSKSIIAKHVVQSCAKCICIFASNRCYYAKYTS